MILLSKEEIFIVGNFDSMKEPLHLLVHEGETFGSKGVEDDAGVPRIALSGSGLLDEAGHRPKNAL